MTTAPQTKQEEHTIDARGKRLGRVATEVATLLMGKHRPDVTRHIALPIIVTVTNASKLLLEEKKRAQTKYDRYSGYPDGRSELSMQQIIDRKGYGEIVRKAVYGMLPNNKLRAVRMKKLIVTE